MRKGRSTRTRSFAWRSTSKRIVAARCSSTGADRSRRGFASSLERPGRKARRGTRRLGQATSERSAGDLASGNMSESRQTVEVVSEGGVLRIILSRREARNALSFEMLDELERSLDRAVGDRGARVLLLESSGDVFCAGMDLRAVALEESAVAERFSSALARIYRRLITLEIPLLCAVDGPVIGGGLGLVAAAALLGAGPGANFRLPGARLGLWPALVSVVLARRLRPKRILGLALSALPLDARGALELGIADRLSHESAAGDARAEAARMIRDNSPKAMR